ncbi:hypothetical protein P4O66_000579 [Electrophorus voltai]|uniref:Uncharacterized protein n=1 Tax=Electrophorus voltai TaxID=2609070 RepID=A0AAD9DYX0_9TELE|nr:hypothetical protein P4O66_000579 [Electrophorus voltai]
MDERDYAPADQKRAESEPCSNAVAEAARRRRAYVSSGRQSEPRRPSDTLTGEREREALCSETEKTGRSCQCQNLGGRETLKEPGARYLEQHSLASVILHLSHATFSLRTPPAERSQNTYSLGGGVKNTSCRERSQNTYSLEGGVRTPPAERTQNTYSLEGGVRTPPAERSQNTYSLEGGEKELRRQQAVILKHQERERRRQHIMLMKAVEARKKAEERERLKQEKRDEKRLNKERKQELRRLEMEMIRELKKPQRGHVLN